MNPSPSQVVQSVAHAAPSYGMGGVLHGFGSVPRDRIQPVSPLPVMPNGLAGRNAPSTFSYLFGR